MFPKIPGFGFRVTGLVLGAVGAVVSTTAIVFSAIGWYKLRKYNRTRYK